MTQGKSLRNITRRHAEPPTRAQVFPRIAVRRPDSASVFYPADGIHTGRKAGRTPPRSINEVLLSPETHDHRAATLGDATASRRSQPITHQRVSAESNTCVILGEQSTVSTQRA